MMFIDFLIAYTILVGLIGLSTRFYIASFLLSTETIYSKNVLTRYFCRYAIFSLHYLISFFVTWIFLRPLIGPLKVAFGEGSTKGLLYFAACIPISLLLYYLDAKFMASMDARKVIGRENYKKKFKSRRTK